MLVDGALERARGGNVGRASVEVFSGSGALLDGLWVRGRVRAFCGLRGCGG